MDAGPSSHRYSAQEDDIEKLRNDMSYFNYALVFLEGRSSAVATALYELF